MHMRFLPLDTCDFPCRSDRMLPPFSISRRAPTSSHFTSMQKSGMCVMSCLLKDRKGPVFCSYENPKHSIGYVQEVPAAWEAVPMRCGAKHNGVLLELGDQPVVETMCMRLYSGPIDRWAYKIIQTKFVARLPWRVLYACTIVYDPPLTMYTMCPSPLVRTPGMCPRRRARRTCMSNMPQASSLQMKGE